MSGVGGASRPASYRQVDRCSILETTIRRRIDCVLFLCHHRRLAAPVLSNTPTPSTSDARSQSHAAIESIVPSGTVVCRGVRGAVTVDRDEREEVLTATRQMLALLIRQNDIDPRDLASAQFTVTRDIQSEFPALAARQLGWAEVPLLCGYEISVDGSLPRCIRVLLHWNTAVAQHEIRHVYLRDAQRLRPDLSKLPPVDFDELEQWINAQMGN